MTAERLFQATAEPADLVISGARVVDPGSGLDGDALDLRIQNGVIAEIGSGLEGPDVIDARGLTVLPGLIDPHVHLRTPGQELKEDIESGTRAAASGGFVAILAMPNTTPVVDSVPVLEGLIARARAQAHVATGFIVAISRGLEGRELTDMGALADAGAAAFSDDGRPVERAALLRRALQYSRITDLRLTLHEEDMSLADGGQMHEGAVSAELGLQGHPSIAESIMIGRDIQIAAFEGTGLHICHVSAAESVAEIRRAKAAGVEITAEVSPHHLCLTDEVVRRLDPASGKMNPPLRSAADRAALIEALQDGTLDCIATDHAPHLALDKDVPWEQAANGVIGLETALPAIYTHLVEPGLIGLSTAIERMTAGPATAFGLKQPTIRVGSPANLAVWDFGREFVVEPPYQSRSTNCAFAGQRLRGVCSLTIAGGSVAHRSVGAAVAS
jgi:dihydroorotase